MRLTIHRGTHQIGGSCIELAHDDSRIILDVGMPLPEIADGKDPSDNAEKSPSNMFPQVPGLFDETGPRIDGVILSHAHMDHYGLAGFMNPKIQIHASEGTRLLLDVLKVFLPDVNRPENIHTLLLNHPESIGKFQVTGLLMDHSAPDALALLVEGDGKRIFYTGDLRGHGRKARLFEKLVEHPPEDIDCLLMEGTMLGRGAQEFSSEEAVEQGMVEALNGEVGPAFIFCSSQNIDRVVSVYRACLRTSTTLVMDLYTAYVLKTLSKLSSRLPQVGWKNIRVKFWKWHAECLAKAGRKDFLYECNRAKIEMDDIAEGRKRMAILARPNSLFAKAADRLDGSKSIRLIWSMWPGYLTPDNPVVRYAQSHDLQITTVHTSGHATVQDLQRLAEAMNPRCVIPIHTELPERYASLFRNVTPLNDGECLRI